MKLLGFATLLALVGFWAGSTAWCGDLYVTVLTPTNTITVREGTMIDIPLSIDFSTAQDSAADGAYGVNLSGFDLQVGFDPSAVSLSEGFATLTPGTEASPSFLFENTNWKIGSDNPPAGIFNAYTSDAGISDVAALETLPTLDLHLFIKGHLGTSTVTIGGEYPPYFDYYSGTEIATNGPIQLDVIVPEPASFSLLLVALAAGGGVLAARCWRRT